jgi:hypothetical protein
LGPPGPVDGSDGFADVPFGADGSGGFVHGSAVWREHTGADDTCGVLGKFELVEGGSVLTPRPVSKVLAQVAEDVRIHTG